MGLRCWKATVPRARRDVVEAEVDLSAPEADDGFVRSTCGSEVLQASPSP